jgi:dTDP-4-amino-4,6-dideoxygalactose transaminase
VAEAQYQRIVSLPLYTTMSDSDADDVIGAVRDIVRTFKR